MVRVLLAYASQPITEGLQALLRAADLEVIQECATAGELRALASQHTPDVLVVELATVGPGEFHILRQQLAACANIPAVLLTSQPEPGDLSPLLSLGAKGIIANVAVCKELIAAVHAVHTGRRYLGHQWHETLERGPSMDQAGHDVLARLTPRERQIFRLLAVGCSTAEVAAVLDISPKTVGVHRSHLLGKLHLKNNAHIARLATELGLLDE